MRYSGAMAPIGRALMAATNTEKAKTLRKYEMNVDKSFHLAFCCGQVLLYSCLIKRGLCMNGRKRNGGAENGNGERYHLINTDWDADLR